MRTLHFRGLLAAMSIAATGGIAFGQYSPYQGNAGLSGSSFPINSGYAQPQYILTGSPVGTGVPQHTLIAQESTQNLPALQNDNRQHVHIPPGNYLVPGNSGSSASASTGYSATVPASGMMNHQMQPTPVPQSYSNGSIVVGGNAGCTTCGPGEAGYSTAPSYSGQPIYSSPAVESYSATPSYIPTTPQYVPQYSAPAQSFVQPTQSCGPTYGSVPTFGLGHARPQATALSVVSPRPWIFGANALIFDRADREYVRFAHDSNMPSTDYLSTRHVRFDHAGGYELFGGRYFGCGKFAIIGSYWSIDPESQMARFDQAAGVNVRTSLPFNSVGVADPSIMYGIELPTSNMYDRFNGTYSQRLRRDENYQNVEINLLSFALGGAARAGVAAIPVPSCGDCGASSCGDCSGSCGVGAAPCSGPTGACAPIYGARCSPLRIAYLGGFRWFRFDDNLEYAASMTDDMYGGTADDVYYLNNVRNDLYGFQLGGQATYCTGRRLSLLAGTKFGIFANNVTHQSYAGLSDRAATVLSANSYNGQDYSFTTESTDVALLGEGNLGLGLTIGRGWTANVGYRIIGVSGIATAPGQVPRDFGLLDDARHLNRSGSLILHGLTLGGAYNW